MKSGPGAGLRFKPLAKRSASWPHRQPNPQGLTGTSSEGVQHSRILGPHWSLRVQPGGRREQVNAPGR